MAYYKITQKKDGTLKAKIQISGKDPATGESKLFVKSIYNDEGLTEAKFRKFVERQSLAFEDEIAELAAQAVVPTNDRSRVLTFTELMAEWRASIQANLSQNYFEHAGLVEEKFTEYLKQNNLLDAPISEITVRDVQLFLNQYAYGTYSRGATAKLLRPLPAAVNYRELAREGIVTRNASYNMKVGKNISVVTAKRICDYCDLNLDDYFELNDGKRQYSQETIKGYRRVLRTLFNEAVRYNWISENPVCGTKLGSGKGNVSLRPVSEKEVFSITEVQRLMVIIKGLPKDYINERIKVEMMLFTGIRNGELHGLRWSDFDFNRKIVHIERNRQYSKQLGYYEKPPKTESSIRDIPLPDFLIADIMEYYQWFVEFDPDFPNKLDQYYFAVNIYREPAGITCIGNWLRRLEEKHGLKHISCHGLRHTYCSILLSKNVPIQTVSRYMGHSDPTVTLKVYTHFIIDTQQQAMLTLNKLITGE